MAISDNPIGLSFEGRAICGRCLEPVSPDATYCSYCHAAFRESRAVDSDEFKRLERERNERRQERRKAKRAAAREARVQKWRERFDGLLEIVYSPCYLWLLIILSVDYLLFRVIWLLFATFIWYPLNVLFKSRSLPEWLSPYFFAHAGRVRLILPQEPRWLLRQNDPIPVIMCYTALGICGLVLAYLGHALYQIPYILIFMLMVAYIGSLFAADMYDNDLVDWWQDSGGALSLVVGVVILGAVASGVWLTAIDTKAAAQLLPAINTPFGVRLTPQAFANSVGWGVIVLFALWSWLSTRRFD